MRKRLATVLIAMLAVTNLAAYCAAPDDDINPTQPDVTITDSDPVVEQ